MIVAVAATGWALVGSTARVLGINRDRDAGLLHLQLLDEGQEVMLWRLDGPLNPDYRGMPKVRRM